MTPEEMGLAFNQLVARRALYSFAMNGRRRPQEEKEAVEILERQYGRTADLEEFLRTQGLRMQVFDAVALGLAASGRIYVAVRDPVQCAPQHLATSSLLQELIDERRAETTETAAIWATFFLLALLYFLYTIDDRPIEAISAFKDSSVDLEQFLEEVRRRVEQLRLCAEPTIDPQQKRIHDALTNLSEAALETRVKAFFNSMLSLGVLEPIPNIDGYRQTLWSAVDVATNFQRHAGTLAAAGLEGVNRVVMPEVEETPGQEQE
jgi:hypothetical protein